MGNIEKQDIGKKAFKASIWYVVSSITVKAISVITTPIFTRLMTPDEFGVVSTFISWHTLLITFFSLNLTYSIGRAKIDFPNNLKEYTGSLMLLSMVTSIILSLLSIIFINPLSEFLELSEFDVIVLLIYLIFSPTILFYKNELRYRYQYKQNIAIAWYISLSTVILSLIFMTCFDFNNLAIARMLGITIPYVLLSTYFLIISLKNHYLLFKKKYWIYGLKLSTPLIVHTVSLSILSQSDRIFIAKLTSSSDVGIYSLVYSYGLLLTVVTSAISDGWLPYFHDNFAKQNFNDIKINSQKIIVLGCFIGLACIAIAPEMVLLLGGEQYLSGIMCVPAIVIGIVCAYIYTHYVNIELTLKKTKYVSLATIFAAILNVILNAIFIPNFGYVAAAYTTMISYCFLMIIHAYVVCVILNVRIYNNVFMFVSLFVTCCISFLLVQTYSFTLIRYFLVFIGFIAFLWTFKEFIRNNLKILKK